MIGPRPMDTVGNCQKSGISHGCGYDEMPWPPTSWRKLSSWLSFSRPSKNAHEYTPGDEWPCTNTRSPPCSGDGACQKWLKPTSYSVADDANEAMCPPTFVSLPARSTMAMAFQRVYERILCSMSWSPGIFDWAATGMVLMYGVLAENGRCSP